MDFDLTEGQKGIQKAAEEFAKGEFDKKAILGLAGTSGVKSLRAVAQMMLATIIHSSYKHGNTNQVWRYCHDGSTDRKSAEDLLSSFEP